MKTTLIAAGLALSLLGGTAEAQSFRGDRDFGWSGARNEMVRDRDFGRRDFGRRDFGRRDVVRHQWSRGDRLSHRYGRYVAVNDWHRYNLRRPPRGHHWVRSGNDFILAAIASGIIADIMLSNTYGRPYGYGY